MVWDFVSGTGNVMAGLILVMFILIWPVLTQWLLSKCFCGVFSAISLIFVSEDHSADDWTVDYLHWMCQWVGHANRTMGPKAYVTNKALDGAKELSWMDHMCLKIETYCELGEPGRGPTLLMQVSQFRGCRYPLHAVEVVLWYLKWGMQHMYTFLVPSAAQYL